MQEDYRQLEVATYKQTVFGCPTVFEGVLADGREFSIYYRWGSVELELNDKVVKTAKYGDPFCGVISFEEACETLGFAIRGKGDVNVE
ncbi:MAG: hypothetical protein ACOCQR_02505 [bacterium]